MSYTLHYQLRQLRVVWNSLSTDVCVMLVHAFVSSRFDYCNSLLAGVSDELVNRLQSVLGSSGFEKAKVWSNLDWPTWTFTLASHSSENPVQARIIGLQVFAWSGSIVSVRHACTGQCRSIQCCRLRSAAHGDLTVPWTRTLCEWALVVSLSPDRNYGTPWHRN